jgi:putative regulator of septum formation
VMAEAKIKAPAVGDCWANTRGGLTSEQLTQTLCDWSHATETFHVGELSGALATGSAPPARKDLVEPYAACDKAAKDFLGDAWQLGLLDLVVLPPAVTHWRAGARYFRCDLVELRSESGAIVPRKETLKGALQGERKIAVGCGTQLLDGKEWSDTTPGPCTAPHDMEFVGFVEATNRPYPTDDKGLDVAFADLCEAKLLGYTGMSSGHFDREPDLEYGYWMMSSEEEWQGGNRSARCHLMLTKKISRSLKGVGNVDV